MSRDEAPTRVGTVIIAAHDESTVIERSLGTLVGGFAPHEVQVIVACNGCTDDTAERARGVEPAVTVIELPVASKVGALRAAEDLDPPFPRIYLDADVELTSSAARAVFSALRAGAPAARPPLRWDLTGADVLVRAYHRARGRAPAVMGRLWGAGVFGLSATARARFDRWPDVVGEDLFVDRHFADDEIVIVDADPVVVRVPRTTRSLLRVLRRAQRGRREAPPDMVDPAVGAVGPATSGAVLGQVIRSATGGPAAAVDAAVYVGFAVTARIASRFGATGGWERDDSTRTIEPR